MPKKKIEKNEPEKQEKENKIARVNLALYPQLKNSLETLTHIDDETSLNAFVEKILTEYVRERNDEIKEYEDFKKKLRDKKSSKKNVGGDEK